MKDCIFCKIVSGEIPSFKIFENEDFLAFLEINPINIGHTLVIPKKHYETIYKMPDGEYSNLFSVVRLIAPRIAEATKAKKVGISVVGLDINHAHLHILPINNTSDTNFENQKPADSNELTRMAQLLS